MSDKRSKAQPRFYVSLLLAGLAFALFIFSTPALIADFLMLSGNPIHDALLAGEPVSSEDVVSFIQSRERAALWHPSNAVYDDLAMGMLERVRRSGFPPTPTLTPELEQVIVWQTSALRLSPADTYGWSRLAYVRIITEGLSASAAEALTHSIEAAPYEPRLMITRINMAVLLGDKLAPDMRRQIPQMISAAWKLFPKELVQSAQQGRYAPAVEAVLKDNPEDLTQWKKLTSSPVP